MSILEDIVEEVEIKPEKSKSIVRWIVRISVMLIGVAFIFGEIKIKVLNKVDNFQSSLDANTNAVINTRKEFREAINKEDERIQTLYIRFDNHVYNDAMYQVEMMNKQNKNK